MDKKAFTQNTTLNWDRDEKNEKIFLNKIRVIEANERFPNKILLKYFYNEEFKTVDLLQKDGKKIHVASNKVQMKQCYKHIMPLKKNMSNFYAIKK